MRHRSEQRMRDVIELERPFRYATPGDAAAMADLVNFASEGLALHLWTSIAPPGVDPWSIGRERAEREAGGFSYRNTVLAEADGGVAAALIGYALPDAPEPMPAHLPPIVVPLEELEQLAPGTWYVNVLAAYPEQRGNGWGTALLGLAEHFGRATGRRGMSIIVADSNTGARRLYERCGYREAARRPMIKNSWQHPGAAFVLLTKPLSAWSTRRGVASE
jgi:ribosomal protein S18 acetylase RimI-like enzyme